MQTNIFFKCKKTTLINLVGKWRQKDKMFPLNDGSQLYILIKKSLLMGVSTDMYKGQQKSRHDKHANHTNLVRGH